MDEGTRSIAKNKVVGKRYVLVEHLNEGGMADVWRAREADSGGPTQFYAIKLPKRLDSKTPEAKSSLVSRFYREARAHYLLRNSPYIVRLYGFEHPSPDHEAPYLVLELMRGDNLDKLLIESSKQRRIEGRLSSGISRTLALKMAYHAICAVKDMHAAGFAHRDLKPSNMLLLEPVEEILMKQDATLKLGDLGILAEETSNGPMDTQAGGLVGTWQYMSPEYLRSVETPQSSPRELEAHQRADIYALGLILYEMWEGSPFFRPPSTLTNSKEPTQVKAQQVLKELNQRLKLLESEQRLKVSENDVYSLLLRMLSASPEDRPKIQEVESAVHAMANLNHEVLSTASIGPSNAISPTRRLTHYLRAHSWKPPQWVSTLALLGLSMVGGWWLRAVDLSAVMPPQAPNALVQDATRVSENALTVAAPTPTPATTPIVPSPSPPRAVPAPTAPLTSPQSVVKAKPSPENDVVQSLDTMPIESAADAAFIEGLQKKKLLPVVDVKLPHTLEGESLKLIFKRSKPIRAPGQTVWAAYSTNARIDDEKAGAVAVLLRHGESNYYSSVKGFGPIPNRQDAFQPGETLGASREAMPVIQELFHCPQPLTKWGDLKRVKCRSIAPHVWVKK